MIILLSLLAAGISSLSSLFYRLNDDQPNPNPSGYLLTFYFFSFILSIVFFPHIWSTPPSWVMIFFGATVGVLSSIMMLLTAQALRNGPSGLTYAFQNASAIFPGLLLFLILGSNFGFFCSLYQILGMALVLLGLYFGSKNASTNTITSSWLKYALGTFGFQILSLTLIQARCVIFTCEGFSEADDVWFMPAQFGASILMQLILLIKSKQVLGHSEMKYGLFGGISNFACSCLLLASTKMALPVEKSMLFPCFAVASMIFCNIWANRLYSEKFNLKSNTLCTAGILIGSAVS